MIHKYLFNPPPTKEEWNLLISELWGGLQETLGIELEMTHQHLDDKFFFSEIRSKESGWGVMGLSIVGTFTIYYMQGKMVIKNLAVLFSNKVKLTPFTSDGAAYFGWNFDKQTWVLEDWFIEDGDEPEDYQPPEDLFSIAKTKWKSIDEAVNDLLSVELSDEFSFEKGGENVTSILGPLNIDVGLQISREDNMVVIECGLSTMKKPFQILPGKEQMKIEMVIENGNYLLARKPVWI
jgi:hypothetical protein